VTDPFSKLPPTILIYQLDPEHPTKQNPLPIREIAGGETQQAKITAALWGPLNKTIFSASEDCCVYIHDSETGLLLNRISDHAAPLSGLTFSADEIFFLTTSKDRTAKLYDTKTLKLLKTYETDKPVNAGSISPLKDHVLLGGGQDAVGVALTGQSRSTQFQSRIYHMIFEEELATVKGHFGPINAIAYSPDGHNFTSGGEDGYLRIHHLDGTIYFTDAFEDQIDFNDLSSDQIDLDF